MTLLDEVNGKAQADASFAAVLATRDTVQITAAFNQGRAAVRPVTVRTLSVWAAPAIRGRLEQARLDVSSPAYSIALAALDLLGQPMDETFDTVAYADLLDALQAAGIVISQERTDLTQLATVADPADEFAVRAALWAADGAWQGVA